ncbi:MAG: hypothetical protein ABWY48_02005 [Pseudoxanthomonas sp.]
MDPFLDTHHSAPQQVALNMEVELEYWRCCYRRMPFHRQGLAYETYVPAIKFAYDCYLYHHRDELTFVFPALKERYQRLFPLPKRTDWRTVERIIRAVWLRIQSGGPSIREGRIGTGKATPKNLPPPREMAVRKVRNVAHA